MNKGQIKESLNSHVKKFLTSNDLTILVREREALLNEFMSSNFKEGKLELAKLTTTLVGTELAKYIQAVAAKNLTPEIKMEANTSSVLLLTIHDVIAI